MITIVNYRVCCIDLFAEDETYLRTQMSKIHRAFSAYRSGRGKGIADT